MNSRSAAFGIGVAAIMALAGSPALAKSVWQKPIVLQCEMAPGADCNLEASCPADMPFVATGGGGMPKIEPEDHSIAMTMNLPIKKGTWRVRWRNLSSDKAAKAKAVVRIKCSDSAAEAGW